MISMNYVMGREAAEMRPDIGEALRYLGAGSGAPDSLRREINRQLPKLVSSGASNAAGPYL